MGKISWCGKSRSELYRILKPKTFHSILKAAKIRELKHGKENTGIKTRHGAEELLE